MKNVEQDEFDEVVARALHRVDAPDGFSAKVMELAAAASSKKGKLLVMPRMPVWFSGALAASLVMGCLIAERVHVVHQQEEAAATERQFEVAMRVTNQALNQTQEKLARAGLKLGD